MSGRIVTKTKHHCDEVRPSGWSLRHRTVWQCGCGRRHIWVAPGNPNYAGWRRTFPDLLPLWRFRQ